MDGAQRSVGGECIYRLCPVTNEEWALYETDFSYLINGGSWDTSRDECRSEYSDASRDSSRGRYAGKDVLYSGRLSGAQTRASPRLPLWHMGTAPEVSEDASAYLFPA
ncbi:MAG: hypothetical protein ACI4TM_00235 [Candidatus Cryptobacteroides sp.]